MPTKTQRKPAPIDTREQDARKIFEMVRERGPQREIDIETNSGIPKARQIACAARVGELLNAAGIAA